MSNSTASGCNPVIANDKKARVRLPPWKFTLTKE